MWRDTIDSADIALTEQAFYFMEVSGKAEYQHMVAGLQLRAAGE